MNEIVSVIIPTYNASGFILETVNSVLQQSYSNFEILIVNGLLTFILFYIFSKKQALN